MSVLGDLFSEAGNILSVKEEVEITETQLQEQICDEVEVIQNDIGQRGKVEKRNEIRTALCHETEDNQPKLSGGETNAEPKSETIKKRSNECNLFPQDAASSVRAPVETCLPLKNNHTCSVCEKSFRCRSKLERHIKWHKCNRPYACIKCPKRYLTLRKLRRHKLLCTRYKCTLCVKTFGTEATLNSHMNFHRGERPFKCEVCPLSFMSKYTLSQHSKTHSDDKKFGCSLCNRKFNFNRERRNHEKTHSNNSYNYQCDTCKKYFRLEDQYRSHLDDNKCQGYASENPFQCPKCDNETFASIEPLNQHKVEVHPPPKKDHACSICAKAYRRKSELDIHMNSHRDKRPFKCEVCSKPFWSNELLLKHNKTHLGRKYECTMCNKTFTDNSNRRQHEKTHSNRRERYHCITCKKYFKLEDQFRSHYQDNKCEGNSQELHDHEKRTQAQNERENIGTAGKSQNDYIFEKKYKCDECNKEFICKRNLNFHMRSHLPISST